MDDLVTWLRAMLDEDERRAEGTGDLGWLTYRRADGSMDHTEAASLAGDDETWIVAGREAVGFASAAVVYRESRALAEVEAKRRILDR